MNRIIQGDVLDIIKTLPDNGVNCIVTSPPYYGLRDYGTGEWEGGDKECGHKIGNEYSANKSTLEGSKRNCGNSLSGYKTACSKCGAIRQDKQIGLEETPEAYIAKMVEVFREIRRILRDDGTCWLNLGDSYASSGQSGYNNSPKSTLHANAWNEESSMHYHNNRKIGRAPTPPNLKPKNLIGIPWRVALALQADGWYLRSDIIWAKKNSMPESVTDRPTKSHEYVFLLTKSARYWYDQGAIRENISQSTVEHWKGKAYTRKTNTDYRPQGLNPGRHQGECLLGASPHGRNKRSVWTIATNRYNEVHFAVMPEKLVEPCILAGCPSRMCAECEKPWVRTVEKYYTKNSRYLSRQNSEIKVLGKTSTFITGNVAHKQTIGFIPQCQCNASHRPGVVLDPFMGAGTVAVVAIQHGRDWLGIELNPDYIKLAEKRINQTQPSLPGVY